MMLSTRRYGLQSALAHVGVYGPPPMDRVRWAKQLAVYLAALLVRPDNSICLEVMAVCSQDKAFAYGTIFC